MPNPANALRAGAAAAALLTVAGCGAIPRMPDVQKPPLPPVEKNAPEKPDLVRFNKKPVVTLRTEMGDMIEAGTRATGEPLPDVGVGRVVVRSISVVRLLRTLAKPHGISVVPGPGLVGESEDKDTKVTLIAPGEHTLAEIVTMTAKQAGIFWTYRDGVLHVSKTRPFTVRVPTMAKIGDVSRGDITKRFTEIFKSLGAKNVKADGHSGVVTFEANHTAFKRVRDYVKRFKRGRNVIVYDVWIYQVTMNRSKQAGIDWNEFNFSKGDTNLTLKKGASATANAVTNGGFALGLGIETGEFMLDALFNFLSSQGDVRALSRPQIALTNGGKAKLEVGRTRRFISEVTTGTDDDENEDENTDENTNDNANNNGDQDVLEAIQNALASEGGIDSRQELLSILTSAGAAGNLSSSAIQQIVENAVKGEGPPTQEEILSVTRQALSPDSREGQDGGGGDTQENVSVQDDKLELGLKMSITGTYNDGVVATALKLKRTQLLNFQSFSTSQSEESVRLRLPQTSRRKIQTLVRSRPGDVILLGGLIQDRGKLKGENISIGDIPTNRASSRRRRELVVLLRPRLIKIRDRRQPAETESHGSADPAAGSAPSNAADPVAPTNDPAVPKGGTARPGTLPDPSARQNEKDKE